MLLWGMQFSNFFRCLGCISMGGGQYVNIHPYGEWDFKDAGEASLWGSLSGVPGNRFLSADVGASVKFYWPLRSSFALVSL